MFSELEAQIKYLEKIQICKIVLMRLEIFAVSTQAMKIVLWERGRKSRKMNNKVNIITDSLPHMVTVGGTKLHINSDFRTSIRFDIMLRDKSIPDEIKIIRMFEMYYQVIPEDTEQAVQAVLWFYNCGYQNRNNVLEEKKNKRPVRKKENIIRYSFLQDAPYIYAAFQEQYHIDLQQIKDNDLHWWQFIALFDSLREDTQMGKIMYYRTVSTSGMPNAKRRAVNELKKQYALKDEVSCDMKVALAKRNADWKEYVRKRVSSINI